MQWGDEGRKKKGEGGKKTRASAWVDVGVELEFTSGFMCVFCRWDGWMCLCTRVEISRLVKSVWRQC